MLVCGAINWDTTLFVERLPKPGEEVRVKKVISVPGGKGANAAVAAARILGAHNVGVIGMLGVDSIAENQVKILQEEEIDTSTIFRQNQMLSGQAYVVVDSKGENFILSHQAANLTIRPENVSQPNVLSAIENTNTIIVIDPPLETAGSLIVSARRAGKKIIWSPALLTSYGLSAVQKYAAHVDYLILNKQEASSLSSTEDGEKACSNISDSLGGRIAVIVTLGDQGCVLCVNRNSMVIPPLDFSSLSDLRVISTVGAGDTFLGAFGAFKLNGLEDRRALYLANIAAGLKTTRAYTRGSPTLEEIKRYAYEPDGRRTGQFNYE